MIDSKAQKIQTAENNIFKVALHPLQSLIKFHTLNLLFYIPAVSTMVSLGGRRGGGRVRYVRYSTTF